MKTKFYITIGRQKGAGGLEIAKRLSEEFGIPQYDKQLLDIAAKESGMCKEIFAEIDERRGSKFISGFFSGIMGSLYSEYGASSGINREDLFRIQSDSIIKIANEGSAIFVGRCADYILRERANCLNVFITAVPEERVARLLECGKIPNAEKYSNEEMVELLEKSDSKRENYYNYFTYKQWGAAASYDLCLNSSLLGIEGCVKVISDIIKEKGWNK
ncbi:MAG: cytidylate kinase-like family protein [Bacteroidales bacterium]|nr:cytidylate kinase-like family protein [Bacteroidales bacterium]